MPALFLAAALCTGRPAWSAAQPVVGSLSVEGAVWTQAIAGGTGKEIRVWGPDGTVVAGTRVRTGTTGAALLTLGKQGVVGLRPNSVARVTAGLAEGLRIDLASGEALVRLPPGSRLVLSTPTATVRAAALTPVAVVSSQPPEASVRITPDGQTVVRVQAGTVRVECKQGEFTTVSAGERITLARDGVPRIVAATGERVAVPAPTGVTAGTLEGRGAAGEPGDDSDGASSDAGETSSREPQPASSPR